MFYSQRQFIVRFFSISLLSLVSGYCLSEEAAPVVDFNGLWVIDEAASDDTDRQVEISIKEVGGKLPRTGKRGKGRYRGGPEDQELYDHIAYDDVLRIKQDEPEFKLGYPEGFERVFYSDNRSRSISIRDTQEDRDYSFAAWEGSKLVVQTRPRDGGWIIETFSLQGEGQVLKVEMEMKPSSFLAPIKITRIFNLYKDD